jgi:hypothetical protein
MQHSCIITALAFSGCEPLCWSHHPHHRGHRMLKSMRVVRTVSIIAALGVAMLGLAAPAVASSRADFGSSGKPPESIGRALPLPASPKRSSSLAVLGGGQQDADAQAEQAGAAAARRSGRPVTVAGLTTETTTVTAQPGTSPTIAGAWG